MKHRIVVLGAGYAGAYAAGTLARRLSPEDTEITVVNAEPDFVQRLRLHQLAAGQEIEAPQLADVFAGTGIRLRLARVTAVDPERRIVAVAYADGGGELGYDTLVYALGSHGDDRGVPGVAEHAFDVAARPSALRLRERLDSLEKRGEGVNVLSAARAVPSAQRPCGRPGSRSAPSPQPAASMSPRTAGSWWTAPCGRSRTPTSTPPATVCTQSATTAGSPRLTPTGRVGDRRSHASRARHRRPGGRRADLRQSRGSDHAHGPRVAVCE